MLIAIDVDSTLHDYWSQFRAAALQLHGVELPYEEQRSWSVDRLSPDQIRAVIDASHSEQRIAEAVAYDDAGDVIRGWRSLGHQVLITTHRREDAHDATAEWLENHGIPFDDLRCGYRKVVHCQQVGAGLLIDDSPDNLTAALDCGIAAATITHPWNRDLIEADPRIAHGRDWPQLADALTPLLR